MARPPSTSDPTGNNSNAVNLVKAAVAVAVWGASFVATKIALRELTPVALVWARFALGIPVLGLIVLARRQLRPVQGRDLAYFLLLGFIGITLHQWLQSNALVTSQATTTGWIVASTPLFIAALGDPGAIVVGRLGAPGDALILISAVNWAVFSVLSRRGLKRHPAALMMFYVMLLGWILTTVLFIAESGFRGIHALSGSAWAALLFLVVVCSGIAYAFWFDALERLPASRVGAFLYLEPLFTVTVAAWLIGEPVRLGTMLGGPIILLGVWLVNRKRR